jgi:hypothetical protein
VKLSHYTVRSRSDGAINHQNLRSWVLEGSVDGSEWAAMDERRDSFELNRKDAVATFRVRGPIECWFVRLRQTARNHCNNDYLSISAFELFGTLLEFQVKT